MDARRKGKGRCKPPTLRKKYVSGFLPMCSFFPCVENVLGLSPLTKISGGAYAFAVRVVPNNVALAEFERNCETSYVNTYIGAHFHIMLRKSIK